MLHVSETFIDRTRDLQFGDSGVYETCHDRPGELYRAMRAEYGRCMGKVYVDRPEGGEPQHVGWVFIKRDKYEDTGKPYLREVWVTVHARKPENKTKFFYADMEQ